MSFHLQKELFGWDDFVVPHCQSRRELIVDLHSEYHALMQYSKTSLFLPGQIRARIIVLVEIEWAYSAALPSKTTRFPHLQT